MIGKHPAFVQQAAGREVVAAEFHSFGHVRLHGFGGDAERGRDLLVGVAFEITEHDDLAAAVRERLHGVGEDLKFLLLADGLGDVGRLFNDAGGLGMGDGFGGRVLAAAEEIEGGVAGGGEEEGAWVTDAAGVVFAEETAVGFLDDVVGVAEKRKARLEVGAERGFVRLDFEGEPAGLLCFLQRRHGLRGVGWRF